MPKRKYLPDERRVRKLVREGWTPGAAIRHVMDNDPKADAHRRAVKTAQRLKRQATGEVARNVADGTPVTERNYEAEHDRTVPGTRLPRYGYSATGGELIGWKPPKGDGVDLDAGLSPEQVARQVMEDRERKRRQPEMARRTAEKRRERRAAKMRDAR